MARSSLILASALVLALAGGALGQGDLFGPSDRTEAIEFSLQARYVGEADFGAEGGSALSTEDDLGMGFSVGYNFNERYNVGCFFSWRTLAYSAHLESPDFERPYDISGWMDTATFGVNGTVNILKSRFTPYVQGAFGWGMVDTNIPAIPDIECWWDPWWGYICVEAGETIGEDGASYLLGAGLSWQLTDTFFMRCGYEKNWLDINGADDFDIVRLDAGFLYR